MLAFLPADEVQKALKSWILILLLIVHRQPAQLHDGQSCFLSISFPVFLVFNKVFHHTAEKLLCLHSITDT